MGSTVTVPNFESLRVESRGIVEVGRKSLVTFSELEAEVATVLGLLVDRKIVVEDEESLVV